MAEPPHPLEPDRGTVESWIDALARFALDHDDALQDAPAVGALGAAGLAVAGRTSRPISENPLPGGVAACVEILREAAAAGVVPSGPGYMAFVPGSGLSASAIADLVSGMLNRFTGVAAASPALVRLEDDVLRWLAAEFGYGPAARGVLVSGGSLATFCAVVTARVAVLGEDADLRRATVYTSSQAHHCVAKAAFLAGVPRRNVRNLPVDGRFRLDPEVLDTAIRRDREAGSKPFLVVTAAGTTNTGAVDPLDEAADVCATHAVWHHVDAAYGGAFVLCEEGRRILSGMERADSIALDPHKGLFLPFGTGCLLVRDGARLRSAHAAHAHYLQDFHGDEGPASPMDHGPELSRSFRGLRLWLPLMLHGARAFRDALAEKLALAQRFHAGLLDRIAAGAPLEVVAPPQLSTVAFRACRRDGEDLVSWNARNRALNDAINSRGRVFLSSTSLPVADGDAVTLRVCVLGFRTHSDRIDAALEDLDAALD